MSERVPRDDAAEELRASFDAAFSRPPEGGARDASVPLLALRVGGEPVAVRVLETAGLMAARRIVPVPSRRAELLGVSGVRGAVVPIYSLARLLRRAEEGDPRWFVLASAGPDERVGFAVATFERHLVASARDLTAVAPGGAAGAGAFAPELLHGDGAPRPVLSIPALVGAITGR